MPSFISGATLEKVSNLSEPQITAPTGQSWEDEIGCTES